MGFTVWYRSSKAASDADRLAIVNSAAELCKGRTWLSCEPVGFFSDSGDGRILGGSKPNFAPDPEDIESANAEGLPDGTIRDVIDILCTISKTHGVNWEITDDERRDWTGQIHAGIVRDDVLERISAIADFTDDLIHPDKEAKSSSSLSPLMRCLMGRDPKKLKKVLERGDNPNADAYLEIALSIGKVHAAELLLDFGARPRDDQKVSALACAARIRALPLISRLIDMGQDINGGTSSSTPLVLAAGSGALESIQFLIARGANIDKPAHGGVTPLMAAAFWGHVSIVRFLLDCGSNPALTDESERSAADYAALPLSASWDGTVKIGGSNATPKDKKQTAAIFNRTVIPKGRPKA